MNLFLLIGVLILVFLVYKAIKGYSYLNHNNSPKETGKKEINIEKFWITNIIKSILIAVILVLAINHYGKFSYQVDSSRYADPDHPSFETRVPPNAPVTMIAYTSPFKTRVENYNPHISIGNFHSDRFDYSSKLHYYLKATFSDIVYIFLFTVIIFMLFTVFKKFKFKFN